MAKRTKISVIIPAYNEEKYIERTLRGLSAQTFKDFEIIVADGNSTDRTREIARKYGKVVVEKRPGIARGRNAGESAASGEILVFLDADTKPSPGVLEAYCKALDADPEVVAATGPILPLEKTSKRINLGYRFVSVFFVKTSILMGRASIVGSNFAVRRSAFDKAGRFNGDLVTYEDWDLSIRLKKLGRIAYLDDAVVYTSTRRIEAWGISGFFLFHVGNIFHYHVLKKPKEHYEPIR